MMKFCLMRIQQGDDGQSSSENIYEGTERPQYDAERMAWQCGGLLISDFDQAFCVQQIAVSPEPPVVSKDRFMLLWSSREWVAARRAAVTDPIMTHILSMIDNLAGGYIDLSEERVQDDLEYVIGQLPVELVPENQRAERLARILRNEI